MKEKFPIIDRTTGPVSTLGDRIISDPTGKHFIEPILDSKFNNDTTPTRPSLKSEPQRLNNIINPGLGPDNIIIDTRPQQKDDYRIPQKK